MGGDKTPSIPRGLGHKLLIFLFHYAHKNISTRDPDTTQSTSIFLKGSPLRKIGRSSTPPLDYGGRLRGLRLSIHEEYRPLQGQYPFPISGDFRIPRNMGEGLRFLGARHACVLLGPANTKDTQMGVFCICGPTRNRTSTISFGD